MANGSIKTSELPTAANVAATDRLMVLRDPTGGPSLRTVAFSTVSANLLISNSAPANSSASGLAGEVRYDSTYLYICISNNNWKRLTLESF